MKERSAEWEESRAYILFAAIGIGYLFPFSALTQPVDYWAILFPDFNVEFSLTVLYMWVNLIVLTLIVFFGGDPIYKNRIYGGFFGQLIVLLVVPSSWFLHLGEQSNYWIVMSCTFFAAVVTAFIDSCAISFSAQYPSKIQAGLQLGIGLSTLIGSVYRIFTKLVFPVDMVVNSSLLYFYCGAATIMICIYSYYELRSLRLSRKCVFYGLSAASFQERVSGGFDRPPKAEMSPLMFGASPPRKAGYGSASDAGENDYESFADIAGSEASPDMPRRGSVDQDERDSDLTYKLKVFRKALPNLMVVLMLFVSTLLLWPAVVTEIPSYNFPYLEETRWWSLILLFLFAASDCIGRLFVNYRCGITSSNVWFYALMRCLVCCPLVICSAKGILFTNDAWSVFFILILGYTNGYLGSLAIILVNDVVEESEQGLAGTFTGVFLNGGLVLGASLSLFADKIINA